MPNQKNVAINKEIGLLLKEFSEQIDDSFINCLSDAVIDYVGLASYITSDVVGDDVKEAFADFEIESDYALESVRRSRRDYCERRMIDAILLDVKPPHSDNDQYMIHKIPNYVHDFIIKFIFENPNFYGDKKNTVRNIIDKSALFKLARHKSLEDSEFYKEWRLIRILEKEFKCKKDWNDIVNNISKNKVVKFK